jgi:hypothetical protein
MTNLENLKAMSLEELAEWLDKNTIFDDSPWLNSFNENYCIKCESLKLDYEDAEEKLGIDLLFDHNTCDCAFCEVYGRCRFFENCESVPNNKEMIKLWLNSEI